MNLFMRFKDNYNQWYWSERRVRRPFLKHNDAMKYYVIRRYAANMGIGSYIISNLSHIRFAIEHNYIPVIDMYHHNSIDINSIRYNAWDLFFEQPFGITLSDATKGSEYILSSGFPAGDTPNDSIAFLNSDEFVIWQYLFNEYIRFNKTIRDYCKDEYDSLLKGKRILGVLCRGTDYIALSPKGHPIQPDLSLVVNEISKAIQKLQCNYIYLATEDISIRDELNKYFSGMIIENKRVYKCYRDGLISKTENNRDNDAYLTNREYLSSLYLLSRCNGIIAGRTSGLVVTMLLNNRYEYQHIWDLGTYI